MRVSGWVEGEAPNVNWTVYRPVSDGSGVCDGAGGGGHTQSPIGCHPTSPPSPVTVR